MNLKINILLIFISIFSLSANSQNCSPSTPNLIINGEIEGLSECPIQWQENSTDTLIPGWPIPPKIVDGSYDTYLSDGSCTGYKRKGNQQAEIGHAAIGCLGNTFVGGEHGRYWMEYIGFNTTEPLIAGTEYCINWWMTDVSINGTDLSEWHPDAIFDSEEIFFYGHATNAATVVGLGGNNCPTFLGSEELGGISYEPQNTGEWTNHCYCFTPTTNVISMQVGLSCKSLAIGEWEYGVPVPYLSYDNFHLSTFDCSNLNLGLQEKVLNEGSVFISPNPCNGSFTVNFGATLNKVTITVEDLNRA
ncbi:MAG: hypothetical protein HRT71_03260 [Flavobacteriales bacterium]|nr:hypothetical protein [Flavobacteriales bacterium]